MDEVVESEMRAHKMAIMDIHFLTVPVAHTKSPIARLSYDMTYLKRKSFLVVIRHLKR